MTPTSCSSGTKYLVARVNEVTHMSQPTMAGGYGATLGTATPASGVFCDGTTAQTYGALIVVCSNKDPALDSAMKQCTDISGGLKYYVLTAASCTYGTVNSCAATPTPACTPTSYTGVTAFGDTCNGGGCGANATATGTVCSCNSGYVDSGSNTCIGVCSPIAYTGVGAFGDSCGGGGCAANATANGSYFCSCNSLNTFPGFYDSGSGTCPATVCTPNSVNSDRTACSNNGTRTQTCASNGSGWSAWSACSCDANWADAVCSTWVGCTPVAYTGVGASGTSCSAGACAANATANGSYFCSCNAGYYQSSASTCTPMACTPNQITSDRTACSNNGTRTNTCASDGSGWLGWTGCSCDANWADASCSTFTGCTPVTFTGVGAYGTSCSGGGCAANATGNSGNGYACACNPGYYQTGSTCTAMACTPNATNSDVAGCSSHGSRTQTCAADGSAWGAWGACTCTAPYTGASCNSCTSLNTFPGYYLSGGTCFSTTCTPSAVNTDTLGCNSHGSRTQTCAGDGSAYGAYGGCTCSGGWSGATCTVSPASISFIGATDIYGFGSVLAGTLSGTDHAITVQNTGGATATCSVSLSGNNPSNFSITSHNCGTIIGGSTCTINVQGYPTAATTYVGDVTVNCGSATRSSANGLSVTGYTTPSLSFSSGTSAAYGNVYVGSSSGTTTITVTNGGSTAATGCSVSAGDPTNFGVAIGSCSSVPAGSTCAFTIKGNPASTGAKSSNASISCSNGSASGGSYTVTGITPASLTFNINSIPFGSILVGSSSGATTLTVSNAGTDAATGCTVSLSDSTNFTIQANTCGTVPSVGSCTFNVVANPTTIGGKSGNATITCSNAAVSTTPSQITVTGYTLPALTFTAGDTFNFGTVLVGATTANNNITISNSGSTDATGCSLSLADSTNFAISGSCPTVVGLSSCTFGVNAKPTSTGAKSTSVTISCAASVSKTSAAGGLTQVGASLPVLSVSPNTNSFGSILVGSTSATANFTVSNASSLAATGCTISLSNSTDFVASGTAACSSVPALGNCTFQIAGRPQSVGNKTTNYSISCSGPSSGYTGASTAPFTAASTAGGISVLGDSPPSLSMSPLTINFGNVNVASSTAPTSVTITNSGTITATGCSLAIGNATDFTIQNPANCLNVAGSNGSCTIGVIANPKTAGNKATTLSITCASYLGNLVNTRSTSNGITAVGITPALLTIAPDTFSFGSVKKATTSAVNAFLVSNSGSTDATGCTASISDSTNFTVQNPNGCATVPGSSTCSINVVANPTTTGNLSANLNFNCTSGVSKATSANGITVLGYTSPVLTITAVTLTTNVIVGTTSSNTITVSNGGTIDATGCLVVSSETTNFSLSNTSNCNTVPANGSCTVQLNSSPKTAGSTFSTTLSIACAAGVNASSSVNAYTTIGTLAKTSAALSVSANSNNFGSVATGTAVNKAITVYNSGTTDATSCSISFSDPTNFKNTAWPCSTITQSSSCTFNITAQPASTGVKSSNLTISCASGAVPSGGVSLTTPAGGYTMNGTSPQSLVFSPMSIGFGTVVRGTTTSPAIPVKLTNTGGTLAKNCTVTIGDSTNFILTGQSGCNSISANNGYCSLGVAANPQVATTPGSVTTQLAVSCTNLGAPDPITLAGTTANGITMTVALPPPTCSAGMYWDGAQCSCPYGYTATGGVCYPNAPSNEYFLSGNYPVCGPGRLPTTYNFSILNVAGTGVPLYTPTVSLNGFNFPYATLVGTGANAYPSYVYNSQTHCACGSVNSVTTPTATSVSSSPGRFGNDTLEAIASVKSDGTPNKTYGPVAIAKDYLNGVDGRLGSVYGASPQASFCGCPNINEVATAIGGSQTGMTCAPKASLVAGGHYVFAVFDQATDGNQIIVADAMAGLDGKVINKIALPVSESAPQTLTSYQRHIWKCQEGYYMDLVNGKCMWSSTQHACKSGSVLGTNLSGAAAAWATTINKKLSCCMNQETNTSGVASSSVKYDCIDNSASASAAFNTLWASSDDAADGGQLNALLLTNPAGKPITGFYTLDGARCNEFSEFATNGIQPGLINPMIVNGQQSSVAGSYSNTAFAANGAAIPMPSGQGWSDMTTGLAGKATAPNPSTNAIAEMAKALRCPILVRAAAVISCPVNPTGNNAPQYTVKDTNVFTRYRCPVASSMKVHIRAEQVFQITGQAPMVPVDTIMDGKSAANANMDLILRRKYGTQCLPGMQYGSGGCRY